MLRTVLGLPSVTASPPADYAGGGPKISQPQPRPFLEPPLFIAKLGPCQPCTDGPGERAENGDGEMAPAHGSSALDRRGKGVAVPDLRRMCMNPPKEDGLATALTLARRTGLEAAATGRLLGVRGRYNGAPPECLAGQDGWR